MRQLLLIALVAITSVLAAAQDDRAKLEAFVSRQGFTDFNIRFLPTPWVGKHSDEIYLSVNSTETKYADIDVRVVKTKPAKKADSYLFETESGRFVVVEYQTNGYKHHFFEMFFDYSTTREEIASSTLEIFVRARHFERLFMTLNDFTDPFLATFAAFDSIRIDSVVINEGDSLEESGLLKFVQAIKPVHFDVRTDTPVSLSDAFFLDSVVKKIDYFIFPSLKTDLKDNTLASLRTTRLVLGLANSLSRQGVLRWLQPVMKGHSTKRELNFCPNFGINKDSLDGYNATLTREDELSSNYTWLVKQKKGNKTAYSEIDIYRSVPQLQFAKDQFAFHAMAVTP